MSKKAIVFCFAAACIGYTWYQWRKFWRGFEL